MLVTDTEIVDTEIEPIWENFVRLGEFCGLHVCKKENYYEFSLCKQIKIECQDKRTK